MDLSLAISILSIVLVVATFVRGIIKDTKRETKENDEGKTSIEMFKLETQYIKENLKEIKEDIRDIKKQNESNKAEMKTISSEVALQVCNIKMQEHIEKYHTSK